METAVQQSCQDDVLTLYGQKALQTLFISSQPKLMDQYVNFLYEAKNDKELDYLHKYIGNQLSEFEITQVDVKNYLDSLWQ